ncbi:hypothetical protein L2E82_01373 [Cichorium intybus]|uniref:Uncharacterized protein n=1 Tax=Cichorium intybus TaxID=13427 RepID=A0ACB9GYS2_CICIN|nr:hypothetical protein L2E82_01373 [Cichorium intybus]
MDSSSAGEDVCRFDVVMCEFKRPARVMNKEESFSCTDDHFYPDSGFTLIAYSWEFAYLITITTKMVYIKHMITNLGLNTWGFVYYNILLSLIMAPFMTGEYSDVFAAVGSNNGNLFEIIAFTIVSLSCVNKFTITDVVNKFLTVAINGEDESILV